MFERNRYLNQLIAKKHNQLIKVITGIRRSGKSYLLNDIFYDYLLKKENVDEKHIIRFAFDNDEDISLLDKYLEISLTHSRKLLLLKTILLNINTLMMDF